LAAAFAGQQTPGQDEKTAVPGVRFSRNRLTILRIFGESGWLIR